MLENDFEITDVFVVESEAAQLALAAGLKDIVIRHDLDKSFINVTGNNQSMSDWQEIRPVKSNIRYYVKLIDGCVGCPYFCDEGEFCHHPDRKQPHVVTVFPIPDDCPLPETPNMVWS